MSTTAAAPIGSGNPSSHHVERASRWLVAVVVAAAAIGLTVWLLVRSSTHAAETPPPAQSHTSSSTVQLPAACHPRRVGAYLPC